MKIAIASKENNVNGHFGHCEGFTIYDVEDNKILNKEIIKNPGHKPGFLPVFLKDLNVNTIIAGGVGAKAQQIFEENGINVIVGVSGVCDNVIESFIKGNLKSTGSICSEHAYEGHCND